MCREFWSNLTLVQPPPIDDNASTEAGVLFVVFFL